jgi:hypothetical protein
MDFVIELQNRNPIPVVRTELSSDFLIDLSQPLEAFNLLGHNLLGQDQVLSLILGSVNYIGWMISWTERRKTWHLRIMELSGIG